MESIDLWKFFHIIKDEITNLIARLTSNHHHYLRWTNQIRQGWLETIWIDWENQFLSNQRDTVLVNSNWQLFNFGKDKRRRRRKKEKKKLKISFSIRFFEQKQTNRIRDSTSSKQVEVRDDDRTNRRVLLIESVRILIFFFYENP